MNYTSGDSFDFIAACREVLPARSVRTEPEELKPWLHDWRGLYNGSACALLEPAEIAEVVLIVRLAAKYRVPLVPQGGNTSMVGGATPDGGGHAAILSTRRMNRIRSLDPAARLAVVEAGVILETLHERAMGQGLRFPLTLGARGSATIGGLVSTNAGGTQVLRWGTMRAMVEGIEAVLPNGEIYDGLAALRKDNRGYDLDQLLVGAEGTLGIVTAATLRLVPAAADVATAWLGLRSPEDALEVLRRLQAEAGTAIESFELIPARALGLVLYHVPGTRAPLDGQSEWNVLIDWASNNAATRLGEAIERLIATDLVQDAVVAASVAQATAFWRLRDSISEAERAEGPTLAHDISVPVASMPAFMRQAAAAVETRFAGVEASAFGHLGDGNVHFHVAAPPGVDPAAWRREPGRAISNFVYDLVTQAGGSISAEHGIGQMKRDDLARLGGAARLSALAAIKHALDPLGIMNPGKLVPPLAPVPPAA